MQFFVSILFSLSLLAACSDQKQPLSVTPIAATASAAAPADPEQMARRQQIYQEWKQDMDKLAQDSSEPLLTKVKEYLDQGAAFAAPQTSGAITVRVADGSPVFTVLVLLPEDAKLSEAWAERYRNHMQYGAASFHSGGNYMMLRAEPLSPKVRGLLLGHEGFHALAANSRNFADQDDGEFCGEEAVAHRMEIEVMKKMAPAFLQHAKQESREVATSLRTNRGRTFTAQFKVDQTAWNADFGQAVSDLEETFRGSMLSISAVYYGALSFYNGDDNRAMGRLAHYLCGMYKSRGIR